MYLFEPFQVQELAAVALILVGTLCIIRGIREIMEKEVMQSTRGGIEDWIGKQKNEEIAKHSQAAEELKKLHRDSCDQMLENAYNFDKHVIWISGGAIVLLLKLRFDHDVDSLLLNLATATFLASIILILLSYAAVHFSLEKTIKSIENSQPKIREIRKLFNEDRKAANREWRKYWRLYHWAIIGTFVVKSLNLSTYIATIIAFFFVLFLFKVL